MSYILSNQLDGVLFFFHKCGHTNIRHVATNEDLTDSYYYTGVGKVIPAYKNYESRFPLRVGKEPQYILVRNPVGRFYSGYYHYWRQWHEDYDGLRDWVDRSLDKKLRDYSLTDHVELHRIVTEQMNSGIAFDHEKTVTFYLHAVHNMLKDYHPGMIIVKLEDQSAVESWQKHPLAIATQGLHQNEKHSYNVEYPEEILQGEDKAYIHSTYKKACKTFGYRYDY